MWPISKGHLDQSTGLPRAKEAADRRARIPLLHMTGPRLLVHRSLKGESRTVVRTLSPFRAYPPPLAQLSPHHRGFRPVGKDAMTNTEATRDNKPPDEEAAQLVARSRGYRSSDIRRSFACPRRTRRRRRQPRGTQPDPPDRFLGRHAGRLHEDRARPERRRTVRCNGLRRRAAPRGDYPGLSRPCGAWRGLAGC